MINAQTGEMEPSAYASGEYDLPPLFCQVRFARNPGAMWPKRTYHIPTKEIVL